jgi:hypothetical protein
MMCERGKQGKGGKTRMMHNASKSVLTHHSEKMFALGVEPSGLLGGLRVIDEKIVKRRGRDALGQHLCGVTAYHAHILSAYVKQGSRWRGRQWWRIKIG